MASADAYRFVAGTAEWHTRYLRFAADSFGPHGYQANPAYLRWLYEACPLTRGSAKDFHLAISPDDEVIGCIHVQRMLWRHEGKDVVIINPHNTMVRPDYRSAGVGAMLSAQAGFGEKHILVAGAPTKWAAGLRRFGYANVSTIWRARWLRPVSGAARMLFRRMRPNWRTAAWWPASQPEQTGSRYGFTWRWWQPLHSADIMDVLEMANRSPSNGAVFAQKWTAPLFMWRFFHAEGPRHCLLTFEHAGRLAGYVIISMGDRHGITLARFVDWRIESHEVLSPLLDVTAQLARQAGAHLILLMSADQEDSEWAAAGSWGEWSRVPPTMIYHRDKTLRHCQHSFMPSAGDYGFEAFMPVERMR